MSNEQLFDLLLYGLKNCGKITGFDRYTEETHGRRVSWYDNDRIGYEVEENNAWIDISSVKGSITIWKNELRHVVIDSSDSFSSIRVACDSNEYQINFGE